MKKEILLILSIILLTGCTCQYNIKITDNEFYEEIIITGENQNEISSLKNNWEIPIYKDNYISNKISDGAIETNYEIYKYQLDNSKIKFYQTYDLSDIKESTAIYNCFDNVTIMDYDEKLIISTSDNVKCFNSYPPLTKVKINIYSDNEVITHNADEHTENRYTWILEKNKIKPINITFNNINNKENSSSNETNENQNKKKTINIIYVFCLVLGVLMLLGYYIYTKIKEKDEQNNIID